MRSSSATTGRILPPRFEDAAAVADAVLYEGYVLYPYTADSGKNRVRFQWGVLTPPGAAADGAGEADAMQTQVLLSPTDEARLHVVIRFLHVQRRTVQAPRPATDTTDTTDGWVEVAELAVGERTWLPWDETVERLIEIPDLPLAELLTAPRDVPVRLPGGQDVEVLRDDDDRQVGRLVREQCSLTGLLHLAADVVPEHDFDGELVRLTVRLDNQADWTAGGDRPAALQRSFVAAHTLLGVDGGRWMSLMDPPDGAAKAAADCDNVRTWPVLVGEPDGDDTVLSSPIILYDHPWVAPESPGDLYDATENDELLTLRIQTLSDEEKARARSTDPRAAEIIDRSDHLPDEIMERLHGAMRDFHPRSHEPSPTPPQPQPQTRPPDLSALGPFDGTAPQARFGVGGMGVGGPEMDVPWWDPGVDASVDPDRDTIVVAGIPVGRGSTVVLHPLRSADAQDLFLDGLTATVRAVFHDVDGDQHLAVTIDDDPGADLADDFGRYHYFRPDEVVPMSSNREVSS